MLPNVNTAHFHLWALITGRLYPPHCNRRPRLNLGEIARSFFDEGLIDLMMMAAPFSWALTQTANVVNPI